MAYNGYTNPQHLLKALQSSIPQEAEGARAYLGHRFGTLVAEMIDRCAEQGTSERDRQKWHERTLIWQALRLRATPLSQVGTTWKSFHVTEVSAIAYLLINVFTGTHSIVPTRTPPLPLLPSFPGLHIEAYTHPLDDVGGDCYRVEYLTDGSLWILVADVTGHGRGAHLIAQAIPCLWDGSRLRNARTKGAAPVELLRSLDDELRDVLPLGVFVETLAGCYKGEKLTVGSASLCPVIQHCPGETTVRSHAVSGTWLALPVPPSYTQADWPVELGHSWSLASDGLFDQPTVKGGTIRVRDTLPTQTIPPAGPLHDVLVETVRLHAVACGQHDDVTIVTITRAP